MYSFINKEISKGYQKTTIIENYKKILITMMPILPHLSNECFVSLKENNESIVWPKFDVKLIKEDTCTIVIQINGKTRKIIETKKNIAEEELLLKIQTDIKLNNYLKTGSIQKKIFIPNKLINIIIV